MQKLKEYKYIILMALLILGFVFYWYSWRPSKIRSSCFESSLARADLYINCLRENGLEK